MESRFKFFHCPLAHILQWVWPSRSCSLTTIRSRTCSTWKARKGTQLLRTRRLSRTRWTYFFNLRRSQPTETNLLTWWTRSSLRGSRGETFCSSQSTNPSPQSCGQSGRPDAREDRDPRTSGGCSWRLARHIEDHINGSSRRPRAGSRSSECSSSQLVEHFGGGYRSGAA